MQKIYFDNAATTRIDDEVLESMMPYLKEEYGNASSIHSFGKSAKVLLEDARDTVAGYIGADSKEIFFTNSGTESNNFALKGIAFKFLNSGKNHIISSSIEHAAVLDTLKYLTDKFKFEITLVKPESSGFISPEKIFEAVKPRTFLISIMHSNNELGTINSIKEISETAIEKNIFVHTDSVQSIGKTIFNVKDSPVNFATLSAHKFYGPKGIAALYVKDKTPVEKFIHGGMQERDMRGGTENIPAIAGLKKAVELLKVNFDSDKMHYTLLKKYLTDQLRKIFGNKIIFNSGDLNSLPNVVNISFDNKQLLFDEEMLLIQLDLKGIAVSGGSACTAGTHKPSHVLTEIGRDEKTALGSIRVSFGRWNNFEEINYFTECLKTIIADK